MVINTKDSGKITKNMDMEYITGEMEIKIMKANGKKMKDMDMECNTILMVIKIIMVNGKKIKQMAVEFSFMEMAIYTLVKFNKMMTKNIPNLFHVVMVLHLKKMVKYYNEDGKIAAVAAISRPIFFLY
jgi:hypothetical protein